MFVLIDYNKNYESIVSELKKRNVTPVVLFKLTLNGKNQIKEQFEKINELKQRIKPKYSAIQIQIDRIENTTIGTINNLKNNYDLVIGLGGLNKINRLFLEDTNVDFLRDPHNVIFRSKMDFIHHFNSGINHVLCQFARDKGTGMIFSLNFIEGKDKNKAKEIGRITQNISFCNRYNIPVYLNFVIRNVNQIKSIFEIKAISSLFNMSSKMKNDIEVVLENKINENKDRISDKYIAPGLKFE